MIITIIIIIIIIIIAVYSQYLYMVAIHLVKERDNFLPFVYCMSAISILVFKVDVWVFAKDVLICQRPISLC